MRILFMGTPLFAVRTLDEINKSHHEIVGVVTATDKPAGRGNKIKESAVKTYSISNDLPLIQPVNLKDENFISHVKKINPELIIVVAFRMLPKIIWELPKYGTLNLHASLLPDYRGAAPINWAIINGEKETGITTFFIDDKIDTGAIILKKKISISDGTTAGQLHDYLMEKGAILVIKTIDTIASKNFKLHQQINSENLNSAPKLNRENTKIDWNENDYNIRQLILGLNPFPGAWTTLIQKEKKLNFKIFNANLSQKKLTPSKLSIIDNKLFVGTKSYALELSEVQIEGKKRMLTKDFLKGNPYIEMCSIL
jgi:methionyl-tRNA formyltransferase|tara:strand:+ start:809 stop:1741 length:933 start_codon:yes stop_codon:yes gene_type:complete